jgi:hypothetical protein
LGRAVSLHRGYGETPAPQWHPDRQDISSPFAGGAAKALLARIDEPDKNWKFSLADIHERKYWKDYMKAYEECLHATSTPHAPWYIVPADDKENARLIVSRIVLDALEDLKMAWPRTTPKRRAALQSIRKHLAA